MTRALRRFRVLVITGLLAIGVGAFAAPASAAGLTLVLPCGCTMTVDQSIGVAHDTPAANNPSGVVFFGP
jgi:hypothetical protein